MQHPEDHAARELEKRVRRVHCLLGFPIDIVTMDDVLMEIGEATRTRQRLFISTVNLNFVTMAQRDNDFRNSLRSSNLCVADGIAVKLIGRLLGVPIQERVAGSDILSAIWKEPANPQSPPLKVFFFGGTEAASQLAYEAVNRHPSRDIVCVGNLCPGYGSVEDMSSNAILDKINHAEPDFLIVALGAKKGQAWIMHNKNKLEAPIISHLGATINFLAGEIQRAPIIWQRLGLEWLWRIKEEPSLAKRYWNDGMCLIGLITTRLLPFAILLRWTQWIGKNEKLSTERIISEANHSRWNLDPNCNEACEPNYVVEIDISKVDRISTAAMGKLLLLAQSIRTFGGKMKIVQARRSFRYGMRINGLSDLLTDD